MEKLELDLTKEECEETCPLPLKILPDVVDGIEAVAGNETVEVRYDESKLSEKEVLEKMEERGYKVER